MSKREEERLKKQQERLEKELARLEEMSCYEREYASCRYICGIDEAGRGPLAGPVVAGAVVLPKDAVILYLNDSKTRLVGASENLSAISQNSLAITEETTAEAQELDSSVSLINESAANLQQCAEELKQEIGYFRYLDE